MYRIKAIQPDGSELTIYDPVGAGALPVIGPRSSDELNDAGTLEFSLVHGHSAFGFLEPKKTYIKADLEGTEIFYGRVVNAEPNPMSGQIQYSCAGALSFLQDSEVPPDGKKADGTADYKKMTAEAFLTRCINAHNADIGNDPRRTFRLGTISHSRKAEEREYRLSTYQDTKSTIETNVLNYYGGFIRVRRDNNGLILDWTEDGYGDTDQGVLELGRNIISLLHRMTGEDLFTTIRPVGNDGLVLSEEQTMDLFPSAEMGQYGKIVRSVSFPDAENENDLRSKAQAYINKLQKTLAISSDIKLLDMRFADEDPHGVNLGDKFTHIVGLDGISLLVAARNRDYENPQNDSCTLKNKKAYDGTESTEKSGSSSTLSKRSSRNSASAGTTYKYIHEMQDRLKLNAKEISICGEQIEIHADQLVETANQFVRISHKEGEVDTRLSIIEGTGVFQDSEHITQIAGKFHYDQETGAVELIDGTEFKIHDRDGAMITVGTRLNDLGRQTAEFEGSALWTQRNNITGVCGEFDIKTNPLTGKRTLIIKSGGGIKIKRDNAEFGLYDEGSLTGGILVNKLLGQTITTINGTAIKAGGSNTLVTSVAATQLAEFGLVDAKTGKLTAGIITSLINNQDPSQGTITTIGGDKILIGHMGSLSGDSVETWMQNAYNGQGVFAKFLTVQKLTAETINSKFTSSNWLEAYNIRANGSLIVNYAGVGDVGFGSLVKELQIVSSGTNAYKLQKKIASSDTWTDVGSITFSNATTLSGAWSGSKLTVTASPQGTKYTVTLSLSVAMQQGECYALVTRPDSKGNPVTITSKKLAIVNSSNNSVKLQAAGSDTGLTFTHGKYTAGYNSAHVTGSWDNNVFTYSKTTSGSTNSASVTIATVVGMQSGECYAYATRASGSGNPTTISKTSKKLTIVNVNDNSVKLQAAGSDTGLTFTHGKYTAGYTAGYNAGNSAGYNSGYETGWKDGWRAYYDDAYDWYPSTQHPNWTGKAWIPKRNADLFYSRGGHGDGSPTYCEEWSAVETPGGGGSTHSVGVTTYTSGYTKNTTEVNAKSAASTAMGVAQDKLDVRKLVSSPSYWTWCKASCGGSNKYVLIGF